jgi:hypothetical protein
VPGAAARIAVANPPADGIDPSHPRVHRDRVRAGKHLTRRDAHADDLLGLFDFERAPSLDAAIGSAASPAVDCTPAPWRPVRRGATGATASASPRRRRACHIARSGSARDMREWR